MMLDSRDEEQEYRVRFFQLLDGLSSIAAMQAFALELPAPREPGRDLHARLLTFLAAFEGCPRARFTINRRTELIPADATDDERQAYVALVRRLMHSREISPSDCTFAEAQLTSR